MNRFSASEAALEGFRLTRERPATILAWGGLYFLGLMLMAAIMMVSLGPRFIEMARKGNLAHDPEALSDMLVHSGPAFVLMLVLAVALTSVLTAGIYRLILRPDESGLAHLRLGADEVRLTIVNLGFFAIYVIGLVLGLVALGAAQRGGSGLGFAAAAAVAILITWIGVRLSLVTPMTFALRKIPIGEAWELTRGRFWPLLGMIVLAVIFYVMVWLLISIIGVAIVTLAGGEEAMADIANLTPVALAAYVVTLLMQLVLWVLQIVMVYAPFGVAYQQLHGDEPANPLRAQAKHS